MFQNRLTEIYEYKLEGDMLCGGIDELALILCDAMEFSEVPVRHNEELLNAELAVKLPWPTTEYDMNDAHIKTYLLLQAHLFQVPLPITDYINDTKSILDQTPRVINAFIDVAANERYLESALNIMRLSQMISQVHKLYL
jgi:activating signal cointegrator complex subunit 3